MPNCFSLTRKGSDKAEKLQEVDDKMREHFGAPADPDHWYLGWYDSVGLGLAMGHDWEKIRTILDSPRMDPVIDYLMANYTVDSWYQTR